MCYVFQRRLSHKLQYIWYLHSQFVILHSMFYCFKTHKMSVWWYSEKENNITPSWYTIFFYQNNAFEIPLTALISSCEHQHDQQSKMLYHIPQVRIKHGKWLLAHNFFFYTLFGRSDWINQTKTMKIIKQKWIRRINGARLWFPVKHTHIQEKWGHNIKNKWNKSTHVLRSCICFSKSSSSLSARLFLSSHEMTLGSMAAFGFFFPSLTVDIVFFWFHKSPIPKIGSNKCSKNLQWNHTNNVLHE